MSNIDKRSENNFLIYANTVIKNRAVPKVEDNLKPIHRRILYTLYEDKVTPDKPMKKCATEAGRVLAYSPHGDASVYGALVRLSQWWKLRYPLIDMQGNCGNILGDPAASARYTECRLSPLGMMMLEGIEKKCVEFKPNYDNTTEEPLILPSKFPYILCGNNAGIAVGLSSNIVSHNFTEVMGAIKYYMNNKDCSIEDLMKFIQGPDFPTGCNLINGNDLPAIYSSGKGSVRLVPNYTVTKTGGKNVIVFDSLPYGVEFDGGIKKPLKKYVIEENIEDFEGIDFKKTGEKSFNIIITLKKNANLAKCLEIIFSKTKMSSTVKINNTLIVNGDPKVLNLKELIKYWVDYRSDIIKRITENDYKKTQSKLNIVLGLQKCLSDIDLLVKIVRNAENRNSAKVELIKAFNINEEQANAVLDMKIARLNRLDLVELQTEEKSLSETLAKYADLIKNESSRYAIISNELADIKKYLGEDKRLTQIKYATPEGAITEETNLTVGQPKIRSLWKIASYGPTEVNNDTVSVVWSKDQSQIRGFTANGEVGTINPDAVGYFDIETADRNDSFVTVTKSGMVKVSSMADYNFNKTSKVVKLKAGDSLLFAGIAKSDDSIMILGDEGNLLKLAIKDLPVTGKLTQGQKISFNEVRAVQIANDGNTLFFMSSDNKGKLVAAKDFNNDSRTNKGQRTGEDNLFMVLADERDYFILKPERGNAIELNKDKVTLKSKTAQGAQVSKRKLVGII